jgi:tetratricopeptide (TPR) repeat protein
MATKVNTRFVLILTVTLFAAAGIVGGLWVLQIRSDTTRHIKAGDALMVRAEAATDSGDFDGGQALYEQALKQYGRAVTKDPAELSHLRKLETVLASLRPTTQSRAGELDAMRVEVLRHEVRYRRQDPEAHLNLITELYGLARQFNQTGAWQQVAEAADDMYDSVMSSDPMRDLALLYRGMGNMRAYGLAGIGPISSTATTDEIDDAELDLQNYVDEYEADDLAWAALAESKLSVARRLRADSRTREADDADIQAREILAQALANERARRPRGGAGGGDALGAVGLRGKAGRGPAQAGRGPQRDRSGPALAGCGPAQVGGGPARVGGGPAHVEGQWARIGPGR